MPKKYELYMTVAEAVPYVQYVAKAVKVLDLIYNFGRESAEERAIRELLEHVTVLEADLDDVNRRVDELNKRLVQDENRARMRALIQHYLAVRDLTFRLGRTPEVDELASIADAAAARIDAMMNDDDLWLWSDLGESRTPGGEKVLELVDPDFKVLPLPVLAAAVSTFALASTLHIEKQPEARLQYDATFSRLLAAVSVRPDWIDYETQPLSLPEKIRWRISVKPHALTKHVQNGECKYGLMCFNDIERTIKHVSDVTMLLPAGTAADTLCMAPAKLGWSDEAVIEDAYPPIVILGILEKMLDRLKSTGKLADIPSPQFLPWTLSALTMYAVEAGGRVIQLEAKVKSDLSETVEWKAARVPVATQWQDFEAILPGDWNVVYTVKADHSVSWQRHEGALNQTPAWSGPTVVKPASRVPDVTSERYIAGSNGTFYMAVRGSRGTRVGIKMISELWVDNHPGVATGVGEFSGPVRIHADWPHYEKVFGGAGGVIFGIDREGRLFWHRHIATPAGAHKVQGPHQIGHGWGAFAHVLSVDNGYILGILPNGTMVAYRFHGFSANPTGAEPVVWSGPVAVKGSGWGSYVHIVPIIQMPVVPIR